MRAAGIGLLAAALATAVTWSAWRTLAPPPADAMAAARRDPLDPRALARLSEALARSGQGERAADLLAFAGERNRLDPKVQAALLKAAVEHGDWGAAVDHADAILRTDASGAFRPAAFAFLDVAAGDPVSRPSVVRSLARKPWWRAEYLQGLPGAVAAEAMAAATARRRLDSPSAQALLLALTATPAPPSSIEYRPLVGAMAAGGEAGESFALWRRLARRPDSEAPLRDPQFTIGPDGSPFTWRPAQGVGTESRIEAAPSGVPGEALDVDYDGFSTPEPAAQLLVLAPGAWRLSWRERASGEPRLAWQVRCDNSQTPLVKASPSSSGAWTARQLAVEIPAAGCPAQWLELAATPGERHADVSLETADFALAPAR